MKNLRLRESEPLVGVGAAAVHVFEGQALVGLLNGVADRAGNLAKNRENHGFHPVSIFQSLPTLGAGLVHAGILTIPDRGGNYCDGAVVVSRMVSCGGTDSSLGSKGMATESPSRK